MTHSRARLSLAVILAVTLATLGAVAEKLQVQTQVPIINCVEGCSDALSFVSFGNIKAKKVSLADQCNSTSYVTSLALCTDRYCNDEQQTRGWEDFVDECKAKKVKVASIDSVVAGIDTTTVKQVDTLTHQKEKNNGTILVSEHSWAMAYKTNHHAFGYTMYLLLATAVLIGMINRCFSIYVQRYMLPAERDDEAGSASGEPSSNYTIFEENTSWYHNEAYQLERYVADRLAIMCFYNMPLLFALAGRNDVILWLTGWSYATANIFHRWVARMCTLQGFVHGILWVVMKRDQLRQRFLHRMFWTTGIFALIAMTFMLILSVRPIRDRSYEIFLVVHILLALATLVLLKYHITHMDGAYDPFIWACVGVWMLDRVIRVLRVAILTFKTLTPKGNNTVARLSDSDAGLIRLSVSTSVPITPKAGDYYFLYTPLSLKAWENHPFTVASWERGKDSTVLHFLVAPQTGATKRWRKRISHKADRTDHTRIMLEGPYGHVNPVEQFDRVLMVAGGSGITSMLPYIHRLCHPTDRFDRSITRFIDLVWIVKDTRYAADVLNHELSEYVTKGARSVQFRIHMYITKEADASPRGLVDSLSFHSDSGSSGSDTEDKTAAPTPETPSTAVMRDEWVSLGYEAGEKVYDEKAVQKGSVLSVSAGRPAMSALLQRSLSSLVGRERLAVSACGPAGMTDDMRRAVCQVYGTGDEQVCGRTIEYFEELFSW
ncbi:hypothetical protein IAU60_004380 [Kwoniella sp. DSM 27419]